MKRSIPAGAGEPLGRAGGDPQMKVYPRGCGGTRRIKEWEKETRGLSPRVRGNLMCM